MVGVVGIDAPIVFLDLGRDPFLPATADHAAFLCVGEPAPPARAETVGRVLRALGRIEVQILAETIDRLQPTRVRERHRRLGPAVELERVGRGKRNVKGAATLAGFLRPAPDSAALAMFGAPCG